MPVIYSTDELKRMYERLLLKYPDADVIIIKNSVMGYAFKASARAILRIVYRNQPREQVVVAAASIPSIVEKLAAKGLVTAVCDLDAPPPNEYVGRSLYAP